MAAQDTANYQFANSISFVYAGVGTGAIVGGDGYGYRVDGTYMGSNAIQIDNGKAYLAQSSKIDEMHAVHGLDSTRPMTVTPTSRVSGSIAQTITGDGIATTTVTRI